MERRSWLIFYRSAIDVIDIEGTWFEGTEDDLVKLIERFDKREIMVLKVPIYKCTGWRTALTKKECIVLFAGAQFLDHEMAQASSRLTIP